MTEQQEAMIGLAIDLYDRQITPPAKTGGDWSKAFTTYKNHLLLWYTDPTGSTRILKQPIEEGIQT